MAKWSYAFVRVIVVLLAVHLCVAFADVEARESRSRDILASKKSPPPPKPLKKPRCKTAWDEFDNQLISNFLPYDVLAFLYAAKPQTVLVPNGASFQKLVDKVRALRLTKAKADALVGSILRYHIIPGQSITPTSLGWGAVEVKTLGKPICSPGKYVTFLAVDPVTIKVANTAQGENAKLYTGILSAIEMCESVTAYILDEVMLPCRLQKMVPKAG